MSTRYSFHLILAALVMLCNTVHANCVGNTIDENIVANQLGKLTLSNLVAEFGSGCLVGMTAMTYQFKGSSGQPIWFWLKNEPEPAYISIQRAIQLKVPPNIEVLMAVKVDKLDASKNEIIWPKSLLGKSEGQVLYDAFYSKKEPQ